MKIEVKDHDGYNYSEKAADTGSSVAYGAILTEVGKGLLEINKNIQELVESHPIFEFHSGAYVGAIIVEIDGMPAWTVRYIDDMIQAVDFEMGPKSDSVVRSVD